ncbi:MAG: electron transfer flavoprotein subunit alpha/FixB family protein [Phycisphaerae bacterium]|nr:electron transfer flavoprotein subunit alpha/FixB family protein [Phycisphaerae bacterium]
MPATLVLVEHRDGLPTQPSLQALALARRLTSDPARPVCALLLGPGAADAAAHLRGRGPTLALTSEWPVLQGFRPRPVTAALQAAARTVDADLILAAASTLSKDVLPRLAIRLNATLATDCLEVTPIGDTLRVRRARQGGNIQSLQDIPSSSTRIISIRPNAVEAIPPSPVDALDARPLPEPPAADDPSTRWTGFVPAADSGMKDVLDADVIIAGGRSLKSEANFAILEDLARALGGTVGATRAAVDAGLQPHARQIGLTGKVVSPRLYFACGIDGAIQHLAGIRGSRVIVAINTNKDAPIFQAATYGCIADLFTLVPLITAEVRRADAGA